MKPRSFRTKMQIGVRTRFLLGALVLAFAVFGSGPELASAQTVGFDGFSITKAGTTRGKVVDGYVRFGSGWSRKVYAEIKDTKSDDLYVRLFYKLDRPSPVSDTGWIELVQAGSNSGSVQSDSDSGHDPTNGIWVKLCLYANGSQSCNTPKYLGNT